MSLTEFLKEFGLELAATLAVIGIGFLVTLFRRSIIIEIARIILPELRGSGLVMTYRSMKDAAKSIESSVERTRELKILSNKGTDWIGDDNAVLSQVISRRSQQLKLRILLLSKVAPWLVKWTKMKGVPLQVVKDEFGATHRVIEAYLKRHRRKLALGSGVAYHRDHPVWRFILTDDRVFISSYANDDQARNAKVFEFRGPDDEVYRAFDRYFEYLYECRGMSGEEVAESLERNVEYDHYEISAGAVVYAKIDNACSIVLLKRRQGRGLVGDFTLPKGHVKDDESLQTAVKREIREETGLPEKALIIDRRLSNYPNTIIVHEKERIHKTVCYFLVRYDHQYQPVSKLSTAPKSNKNANSSLPSIKTNKQIHVSGEWCSMEEIVNRKFAYSHTEAVLREAIQHLT